MPVLESQSSVVDLIGTDMSSDLDKGLLGRLDWQGVHLCAKRPNDKLGKVLIVACAVVGISSFISGS